MTKTVLNTKTTEVENRTPDTSSLETTTIRSTKISQVDKKIPDHAKYIITQELNMLTTTKKK